MTERVDYEAAPVGRANSSSPGARVPSARVAARQADARRRILEAARVVVAEHGFAAAQVAVVASVADVATGSIYRHFPSKTSLISEMLRDVCRRELEVVQAIAGEAGRTAAERIGDAVATFVDRALRGEGLAYAVIVEPMDPDVDQVRLEARAGLADAFAALIEEGIASGEFAEQDARTRGAAIVGAFLEGVVAPLAERDSRAPDREAISGEIARFCRAAITVTTAASVADQPLARSRLAAADRPARTRPPAGPASSRPRPPGDQTIRTAETATGRTAAAAAADFGTQRPIPDNLIPDLGDVNAFVKDEIAAGIIGDYAPWAWERAETLGAKVWDPTVLKAARDAQRFTPELRTLNRIGEEVYDIDFHPAYHELMALGFGSGVHSLAWTTDQPGAHSARAVLSYLWNQIDGSTACPLGMAYASIPVLRSQPELAEFARALEVEGYDPADVPIERKSAGTVGYFMTEKHGGSDLRANVTVARPLGRRGPGERYLVNGHKWFASVPMSDCYLTVAQTAGGVSCLLVPRRRPDGSLNGIKINRLKDKLGNKANASSEIEYHDAEAFLVGEEGKGVRTILSSAEYTRLDFAVGSAGLMRAALSQALYYNDNRSAFGSRLSQLPIQAPVLADLALEWAGAAHLGFRVARAEDSRDDVSERLVSRLLTPVAKFWNCRRVSSVTEEVIQSIGGNAYIEEHPCPRYYREAPLNAIWEGTSNMMVMDVGRVLTREPKAIEPVIDEIRPAAAEHPLLAQVLDELEELVMAPEDTTRDLVTRLALAVQSALLLQHAPTVVAEAFIASRLGAGWGPGYGTLRGVDFEAIIDFARLG